MFSNIATNMAKNWTFPHYLAVFGVASLGLFVTSTFEASGMKGPDPTV